MERRAFLAATGLAASTIAGCLGGTGGSRTTTATTRTTAETTRTTTETTTETTTSTTTETTRTTTAAPEVKGPKQGDDLPADPDPQDGFPPAFGETPEERSISRMDFRFNTARGEQITLVPVEIAYYWYARGEARFADARGPDQYERSHVFGAVLSTAGVSNRGDDPVAEWSTDDRIVCYCGCPHHLSSIRAAALQSEGYGNVFVVDEGFFEWRDRGFPLAGTDVDASPSLVTVPGAVDPAFAGRHVLAVHPGSGQREAAPVGRDGRFRLHLRFAGVGASSRLVVRTPEYEVGASLGELADGLLLQGKP